MKRLIMVVLASFMMSSAWAQFSYGLKAGINRNRLLGVPNNSYLSKPNLGFHIGIYANFILTDNLSVTPEFQYIRKGDSDAFLHFNYLEIPILLEYKLAKDLSIQLGPSIGQKIWTYRNPGPGANGITFSTYDTDIDLGITGVLKVRINEKVSILCRYNQGFLPYFRFGEIGNFNTYTESMQLSVSYQLKK